jgi:hypothetical protein
LQKTCKKITKKNSKKKIKVKNFFKKPENLGGGNKPLLQLRAHVDGNKPLLPSLVYKG